MCAVDSHKNVSMHEGHAVSMLTISRMQVSQTFFISRRVVSLPQFRREEDLIQVAPGAILLSVCQGHQIIYELLS